MPPTRQKPPSPGGKRGKRTRHPESPRQIVAMQRGRTIAGLVAAFEADGLSKLTVASVIERARISRKTFYDHFSDVDACCAAAFDDALTRGAAGARDAYAEQAEWGAGTRAALHAVLQLLEDEPGLARLSIAYVHSNGERALSRRALLIAEIARGVELGRTHSDAPVQADARAGEAVAGGILSLLHTSLLAGDPPSVNALAPSLMSLIALPYLGRAGAREQAAILAREARPRRSQARRASSERQQMSELNIRLTYRTLRVLGAVRDHPEASNREIAAAAGIQDQGQVSKLLKRLAGLELIENSGEGQSNGASNAWSLLPAGERVLRTALG